MNDHEVLREAARLLRLYAEPLTELGRWIVDGGGGVDMATGERDSYTVGPVDRYPVPTDLPPQRTMAVIGWGRKRGTPRARHIAGLDPAVAVALAELFEAHARIPNGIACAPGTGRPSQYIGPSPAVVAVARAYLREPTDVVT